VGFTPAVGPKAARKLRQRIRCWRLGQRTSQSLEALAQDINPVVRGWIQYYGAFQRSTLSVVLRHIDRHLLKWVKRKYRHMGRYGKRARRWLGKWHTTAPYCSRIGRSAPPSLAE
jgi:RNA-directed DNA polymerase